MRDIDPDLAATAEAALSGGSSFSLLTFGDYDAEAGFRENCNVIDFASGGDTIGYRLSEDAVGVEGMDRLANGPQAAILELPAGDVGRLDYGLRFPDFQTAHAAYYFTDGSMFHLLTCTDTQRPEDDWLSIAETWEWLDVATP